MSTLINSLMVRAAGAPVLKPAPAAPSPLKASMAWIPAGGMSA